MSAHVLLNLLNKLEKSDKMQGLLSIISLFHNKFNKFNDTGACMIDDIKLFCNHVLWYENVNILPNICNIVMSITQICNPLVIY